MELLSGYLCLRRLMMAIMAMLIASSLSLHSARAAETAEKSADELAAARKQLYTDYGVQLQALAEKCESHGLSKQAEFTRRWLPQRDPAMIYVFILPSSTAPPAALVDTPLAQKWWNKFTELRRAEADTLFALAQTALKNKQYALAFELCAKRCAKIQTMLRRELVLGDRKHGDQWVSPEAARCLDAGQVWSDDFGWLPADHLPRYQNGQRYYHGNWIGTAEDARLHSNIRNGWNVESDHYSVVTNHNLADAAKLATRLEMLYDVWRQVFVSYYAKPTQMEQWFAAAENAAQKSSANAATPAENAAGELAIAPTTERAVHKLHQVVYFHDKQQYVDALKAAQPQIEMSIGFYSDETRTAYFFASDDPYVGTLYHEATHQLFRETPPAAVDPGRKNNFWIVEAIACYMESLEEHPLLGGESYGKYITLGGENAGRVPAVRKRLLDDNFYVPLRELATYGMSELQHDARLSAIYSQISGQAWFLMHADHGATGRH